jgi:hypothetical protein
MSNIISASQLQHWHKDPVKWLVEDYIVFSGLTILASKPKVGKSWLALSLAKSIAEGGTFFGKQCVSSKVLYICLEDGERRLADRIRKLGGINSGHLSVCFEWRGLSAGGQDDLVSHVESDRPSLIIIDTFAAFKNGANSGGSAYDNDYTVMRQIQQIAIQHNVAIMVIHHSRKAKADHAVDSLNGTLGLAGAADSVWVLDRNQGSQGNLKIVGRDIEDSELAMKFEGCQWAVEGDAQYLRLSDARREILGSLEDEEMTSKELSDALGKRLRNTQKLLTALIKEGLVVRNGQKYGVPPYSGTSGSSGSRTSLHTLRTISVCKSTSEHRDKTTTYHQNEPDEPGEPIATKRTTPEFASFDESTLSVAGGAS